MLSNPQEHAALVARLRAVSINRGGKHGGESWQVGYEEAIEDVIALLAAGPSQATGETQKALDAIHMTARRAMSFGRGPTPHTDQKRLEKHEQHWRTVMDLAAKAGADVGSILRSDSPPLDVARSVEPDGYVQRSVTMTTDPQPLAVLPKVEETR